MNTNSINWAARQVVGTKQESWYDRTIYAVPFTGTFDASAIRKAMHARLYSPSCGKFGGGNSIDGLPKDNGNGTFTLETLYSIGD